MKTTRLLPNILIRVLPGTIFLLLVILMYASFKAQETVQNEVHDKLTQKSIHLTNQTKKKIDLLHDATAAIASNDLVINGLIDHQKRLNYLTPFFRSLRLPGSKQQQKITMTDYKGNKIASTVQNVSYAGTPILQTILDGNQIFQLTNDKMTIAVPILYKGHPEGMVVVEFDSNQIQEILEVSPGSDIALILESDGNILYTSDPGYFPLKQNYYKTVEDSQWETVSTKIPDYQEFELILLESIELARAQGRQVQLYLAFAMALSIMALVTGVVFAGKYATAPVNKYVRKIKEIKDAGGDFSGRLPNAGTAEFQALADSFNQLFEELNHSVVSQDYVDKILASISETLFVLTPGGKIQTTNIAGCEMLKYTESALTGFHLADLAYDEEDQKAINEFLWKAGFESKVGLECYFKTNDKSKIAVKLTASPLRDKNNASLGIVCIISDTTQRKQEEAARQAQLKKIESEHAVVEEYVGQLQRRIAELEESVSRS